MAKHYFTSNELALAKAMHDAGYCLENDELGPWGRTRGKVISFDISDIEIDPETFNYFNLEGEKREELEDEGYIYASDMEGYGINVADWINKDEVVVFNTDVSQSRSNFLSWEQVTGELYVDEDDYFEFVTENKEFMTREWQIKRIKKMMEEYDLTIDDLK